MQAVDEFRHAIERAGLTAPETIHADGRLHRFASNGDRSDDAGWYLFFPDGLPAGAFGCWRSGLNQKWCNKSDRQLSPAERAEYRRRVETAQRERDREERHRHAEAAVGALRIWESAQPAPADHPYLERKKILSHGLRLHHDGRLIVPLRGVDGALHSLEFIDGDGTKRFLPGGKKRGCFYMIGTVQDVLCLAEGYATAASIHEATGYPVIVSFDAGNLKPVAEAFRAKYPDAKLILCGDNDENNTGQTKAKEAAAAVGGIAVFPGTAGQDWNDLAVRDGLDAVRAAFSTVLKESCILDEVHAFLGRFVAYPSEHAHVAHTLWIAHTHLMEKWESTPRLAFLSPEPGSGKTRGLEVSEPLVPRPMQSINATAAALFRKVSDAAGPPTILYDEIDTIFGPKAKEHEDIRALINAGHRRGASAHRCVVRGKQIELEEFPAYCAVALAGLGQLPDTILTRSIVIHMRRRAPHESVEPYRIRLHDPEGHRLRDRLAMWAKEIAPSLSNDPPMPPEITDRDADVWEAPLSIADAAGGDWPERARVAAVTLVTCTKRGEGSLGVRLLEDLRTVFGEREALATAEILELLVSLEESPWGDLRGKPLDGRRLSKLLKPYGIAPKVLRIGAGTYRGYERIDLQDAWVRYLPPKEESPLSLSPTVHVTSVTPETPDLAELIIEEGPDAD